MRSSADDATPWKPGHAAFIQLVLKAIAADDAAGISKLFQATTAENFVPINSNIGSTQESAMFLDYAAARCKANAIDALIANGADPNIVYSDKPNQDARTLFLAAATCRELDDAPYIRKAMLAFFNGQKRANPNPVDALSDTVARPQFHAFLEDCQRSNPGQGYLVVAAEWIKGGLAPGASATSAQGGATALHVAAADPLHDVCKNIALMLAQAASSQDFLKTDNKNRIPADYTFGPARKQIKKASNEMLVEYWIDCLAFSDKNSAIWRHQNQILNAYLARNNAPRDMVRACGATDGVRAVNTIGTDKQGRRFIWQSRLLPGSKGNAPVDDPACDSPAHGWSSCQYLSVYPVPGRYELTADYKLVWKEADQTCTHFDPRNRSNPIVDSGFRECHGKCGNSNAIYFDGKLEVSSVEGKRMATRAMRRVSGLYKNWGNQPICIGLLVYLK
ncbi:MAG: hypothetical protein ACO1NY_01410 [Pseudorhodoplanes sp.]